MRAGRCRAAETDVLASLEEGQPHMLIPGEAGPGREAALRARLDGRRAAIGLTVPLADAADSLRWARQALDLAEAGAIDAGQIVHSEEHLVTLWLMSDSALAEQISRRQLGALDALTPRQRERLTETFGAWLETRGTASEIADRLKIHPQTVRYRIRQLERTLGERFGDPEARFAMEMVLRVMQIRGRSSPVIEVQHVVQGAPGGGTERLAGVVGGGDQDALPDVAGQAEDLGGFLLVGQVQRGPGRTQLP